MSSFFLGIHFIASSEEGHIKHWDTASQAEAKPVEVNSKRSCTKALW